MKGFVLCLIVLAFPSSLRADCTALQPDFDRDVAVIFAARCFECHNPTEKKGGLDLTRKAAAVAGGENGVVFLPGKPAESPLWKNVSENEMPPKHPLPADEKETLRRWIASGAAWGTDPIDPFRFTTSKRAGYDWWSLQPVRQVDPPPIDSHNPIDRFILARLKKEGLSPSPAADRRTLLRRVTFDLTGLPPTPEDVAEFIADPSPDAYEKRVDRLLASPEYGVRGARAWLDLARFGESNGFERDQLRPNAWRYRDWVVQSMNADLPYDEFARMQLAGDLLHPGKADGIIATGFLVAAAYDEVGQSQQSAAMRAVVRQDELEDYVGTVGQTFLGLTVNCARCHDHKFDPIATREYYQLASALSGVKPGERQLPLVEARAAADKAELMLVRRAGEIGIEITRGWKNAALPSLGYELKSILRLLNRARVGKTYACSPAPATPVAKILLRGSPMREGAVVTPAGIAAVAGVSADFGLKPDASDRDRRLKLAEWMTDSRNPLFARVMVNRLWQMHFGAGIVETPSDFGFNGGRPTHPQLLDWLAAEFVKSGYSQKQMHRLMVTAAVYRQASTPRDNALKADASNRYLWRMTPRRVEAESLRDAILFVSGELHLTQGGPGFEDYYSFTQNTTFYEFRDYVGPTFQRRSLYRTWVRSGRSPLLDVFDCPDPSTKTPRRSVTTTPLQAMSLMNNSLVLRMSDALAARADGATIEQRIDQVYSKVLCRNPSADELAEAKAFILKHGMPAFCRVLLNYSEFVCID